MMRIPQCSPTRPRPKVDTGYLSLTRGEGGQNLIGSEQGNTRADPHRGIARRAPHRRRSTVLHARNRFRFYQDRRRDTAKVGPRTNPRRHRLDHPQVPAGHHRPAVLRHSRDGHGQHQTSAILGKEAFTAAADPNAVPGAIDLGQALASEAAVVERVRLQPRTGAGRRKRQEGRKFRSTRGEYNPVLGLSYGEIAGMSRSQHRSQGMGAPERKGSRRKNTSYHCGDQAQRTCSTESISPGTACRAGPR